MSGLPPKPPKNTGFLLNMCGFERAIAESMRSLPYRHRIEGMVPKDGGGIVANAADQEQCHGDDDCSRDRARCLRIGLGTWAIGGWMWGGADDRESIRTIHAALAKGINLLDTAPVYGFGHSEEIVGQAITQLGCRDKVIIATKVGLRPAREFSRRWTTPCAASRRVISTSIKYTGRIPAFRSKKLQKTPQSLVTLLGLDG